MPGGKRDTAPGRLAAGLVGATVAGLDIVFQHSSAQPSDGRKMLLATTSLMDHGFDGLRQVRSKYGIGTSLAMFPFEAVQRLVADPHGLIVVTLAMVTMTALTAALLFRIGVLLRWPPVAALGAALVYGALTMSLNYSSVMFSESGVTLGATLVLLGLILWRQERPSGPWLAGIGVATAILFRNDSALIVAVGLATAPLFVPWRRILRPVREPLSLLGVVLPIALSVAWVAFYNDFLYGSPLNNGYGNESFTFPFLAGLFRNLLSPGKGFWEYNPILLLALPGVVLLWRRDRAVAAAVATLCLSRVLFYASWWDTDGALAWGPRFLLPWCALLSIPCAESLMWVSRCRGLTRVVTWTVTAGLAALSALISFLSVYVNWGLYYFHARSRIHLSNDTFGPLNPIIFAFDHVTDPHGSVPAGRPDGRILLDWWRGGPSPVGVLALLATLVMAGAALHLALRSGRPAASGESDESDAPADGSRQHEERLAAL